MPNPELRGLVLTKSERIFVIALSYLFCAPVIYVNGRRLLAYFLSTRRQVRGEAEAERQAERRRRR